MTKEEKIARYSKLNQEVVPGKKKAYPIIIYRLFMMIAMEQSGSVLSMGWMFMLSLIHIFRRVN